MRVRKSLPTGCKGKHIERLESIGPDDACNNGCACVPFKESCNKQLGRSTPGLCGVFARPGQRVQRSNVRATNARSLHCTSDDEEDRDVATIFNFKSNRAPKTTPPIIKRRNMTCTLKQQKRFKNLHKSYDGLQSPSPPPRRLFERFGYFAGVRARGCPARIVQQRRLDIDAKLHITLEKSAQRSLL